MIKLYLINFKLFFLLTVALLSGTSLLSQTIVFFEDFSNPAVWTPATGFKTVKTIETDYGTVKYLDLTISNDPKEWSNETNTEKITKVGYITFNTGSSTISTSNSYIQLPPISFVDGGSFTITYGAGSTNKRLRLQEWNGTAWENGSYDEIKTLYSSRWYTQTWNIEGTGEKIFRLVQTNSAYIIVADITANSNSPIGPTIEITNPPSLDFGTFKLNEQVAVKSFFVKGSQLSQSIVVEAPDNFLVLDIQNGTYKSVINLPTDGGTVYVKCNPTTPGTFSNQIKLNSTGAVEKTIPVTATVLPLSNEKQITSFSINGIDGYINEELKTILVRLPYATDLLQPFDPIINISPYATISLSNKSVLEQSVEMIYIVQAENGNTQEYEVWVERDDPSKTCDITAFSIGGVSGIIDEVTQTISVKIDADANISNLSPIIEVSAFATISPESGSSQDFSYPVVYTVTAQDVSVSKVYQINVIQTNDKYVGPYPYISNMDVNFKIPYWVSGYSSYENDKFVEGGCKNEQGTIFLKRADSGNSTLTLKVSECGVLKVGLSAFDTRTVLLASNKNDATITVNLTPNECQYATLNVNSNQPTELYITVTEGADETNLFYVEVTAYGNISSILPQIKSADSANVFWQSNHLVVQTQNGGDISVYSLTGNLLLKTTVNNDNVVLPLPLKKGIYLVIVNGEAHKLFVK